jgi:excisionase family DNA binding protein
MQDHDARRTEASPRTRLLHSEDRLTWTITEAAQLLGISRATAYEAAHRGELPVRLIGRRMLVPPGGAPAPPRAGHAARLAARLATIAPGPPPRRHH